MKRSIYRIVTAVAGACLLVNSGVAAPKGKAGKGDKLKADASAFDPLDGKVYRANLGRTGLHKTSGAPSLSKVRWKFKTGAEVRSSPVVVDGVVYVGSNDKHVYAIDLKTGALKWKASAGDEVIGSAAVVDGAVYIPCKEEGVLALNAADGKELWRAKTGSACGGSPVIAYGAVIISAGAKSGKINKSPMMTGPIMAFSQSDGKLIYSAAEGIFSSAAYATDGRWLFGHYPSQYSVHSIEDGSHVTDVFQTGGQRYPWGSVSYVDGVAYYPLALGGYVDAYTVEANGSTKLLWRNATVEENLGVTVQLGAISGHEILGDMAVTDELVLAPCWDGGLYAFSTKDGKLAWKYQIEPASPIMGSPSVAGGVAYFGAWDGHLYAIGPDGKLKSKIKLGGRLNTSPWPADGVVVVGSDDGNVYAVE